MFKGILVIAMGFLSNAAMATVGDLEITDDTIRKRIEIAIESGYSVAECRNGSCTDFESGQPILIDNYEQDGFYIYWDEEKPGRRYTDNDVK